MALFTYTVFIKMYVEINDGRDGCLERQKGGGDTLDRGNKRKENRYKY